MKATIHLPWLSALTPAPLPRGYRVYTSLSEPNTRRDPPRFALSELLDKAPLRKGGLGGSTEVIWRRESYVYTVAFFKERDFYVPLFLFATATYLASFMVEPYVLA